MVLLIADLATFLCSLNRHDDNVPKRSQAGACLTDRYFDIVDGKVIFFYRRRQNYLHFCLALVHVIVLPWPLVLGSFVHTATLWRELEDLKCLCFPTTPMMIMLAVGVVSLALSVATAAVAKYHDRETTPKSSIWFRQWHRLLGFPKHVYNLPKVRFLSACSDCARLC